MRYRYILNGAIKPNDKISDYHLLDKQKLNGFTDALRIQIPNDAVLEKWSCDEYSTWDSSNTATPKLKDMNPTYLLKINGKWQPVEEVQKVWLEEDKEKFRSLLKEYSRYSVFNVGYISKEQYIWYQNNLKYSWRFDSFPSDLSNVAIPPLTSEELETLDFVREQFKEHYEQIIDTSIFYEKEDKDLAKAFFKDWIESVSNDDLAFEWHDYSTGSLDPRHKFETKTLVDKICKSLRYFVSEGHYIQAITRMLQNLKFSYLLYEQKMKEAVDEDFER